MAILKHLVVLLLVTSIFPGCTSLPETNPTPQVREGIAWIERQFKTCSGKSLFAYKVGNIQAYQIH